MPSPLSSPVHYPYELAIGPALPVGLLPRELASCLIRHDFSDAATGNATAASEINDTGSAG
jgi:hypothetical protein